MPEGPAKLVNIVPVVSTPNPTTEPLLLIPLIVVPPAPAGPPRLKLVMSIRSDG